MQDPSNLNRKERESAALLEEATRIVRTAEGQSRALTAENDARVLELMAQVRSLDEEIGHLRRHSELGQHS